MAALDWTTQPRQQAASGERSLPSPAFVALILVVFTTQLAAALWLNSRDYLWGDADSRAASALIALKSADPHLAAIGFVWMPLPTVLELIPVSFYSLWHGVVAGGFAASIVTVFCGTLTSAIVFATCRKLGLSEVLSAIYAAVVSFSPMLFLYSTNGMSEGVAAPFMIGSVCCLLLFWQSGGRRYIAASGVMLMLAFTCIYEAAPFGAALLFALVVGVFSSENTESWRQGRKRAVQGLSILLLVPSAYFGILWVIANTAIMGNPFYFATSAYSNEGYIASSGVHRLADSVKGDMFGSIEFAVVRTLPFLLPIAFIMLVRLIDKRAIKPNSLTLIGMALIVPLGLLMQLYDGTSFGWLRYFMYPLFVAAGWGAYEIAQSQHRKLATALVRWLAARGTRNSLGDEQPEPRSERVSGRTKCDQRQARVGSRLPAVLRRCHTRL